MINKNNLLIVANTGGLLGLFMGFSVVSIIELIYFMTFRPYCARVRYTEDNQYTIETMKSSSQNQQNKGLIKHSLLQIFQRIPIYIKTKFNWKLSLKQNNDKVFYPYID